MHERCSASRMKGELHPTMNRMCGGPSFIWIAASNELMLYLGRDTRVIAVPSFRLLSTGFVRTHQFSTGDRWNNRYSPRYVASSTQINCSGTYDLLPTLNQVFTFFKQKVS